MLRVYNYMAPASRITGVVAYLTYPCLPWLTPGQACELTSFGSFMLRERLQMGGDFRAARLWYSSSRARINSR